MEFLKNKYTTWYFNIVNNAMNCDRPRTKHLYGKAKSNGDCEYLEFHHVIPKSLGGDNSYLVALTAKEHYVLHHLLTKMVDGDSKTKMQFAFWRMMNRNIHHQRSYKPHQYEAARKEHANALSKRMKGRKGKDHPGFGSKRSASQIEVMRINATGSNNGMHGKTGELNPMFGIRGEDHPLWGRKHSVETKRKMSENSARSRPEVNAKIAAAHKALHADPEYKERHRAAVKAGIAKRKMERNQ
jgi:hypothetical protein